MSQVSDIYKVCFPTTGSPARCTWIGTSRIGTILDRDNDRPDVSSDDSISRNTSGGDGDSETSVLTPALCRWMMKRMICDMCGIRDKLAI